jgi:hypothetical protein
MMRSVLLGTPLTDYHLSTTTAGTPASNFGQRSSVLNFCGGFVCTVGQTPPPPLELKLFELSQEAAFPSLYGRCAEQRLLLLLLAAFVVQPALFLLFAL